MQAKKAERTFLKDRNVVVIGTERQERGMADFSYFFFCECFSKPATNFLNIIFLPPSFQAMNLPLAPTFPNRKIHQPVRILEPRRGAGNILEHHRVFYSKPRVMLSSILKNLFIQGRFPF